MSNPPNMNLNATDEKITIKHIRGDLIRCQKNSLYDEASRLFEKMKAFEMEQLQLQQQLQQPPKQQKFDENCWNMMISLCEGNLDLTYEVFLHMKTHYELTEIAYTMLIKRLCECEQFTDAFVLLTEMSLREKPIKPHLRTILPFFGKKLEPDMFRNLCQIIVSNGLIPTFDMFGKMLITSQKNDMLPHEYAKIFEWIQSYYDAVPDTLCEVISNRIHRNPIPVVIDNRGVCSNCGFKLEKMDLTDTERQTFLKALEHHFAKFLSHHSKYDVIVDGANVSMYNNSPFNPKKVEAVVDHFTQRGAKVLVVFNIGRKQQVSKMNFLDSR
jgi:pentatricopeptide repeat protein